MRNAVKGCKGQAVESINITDTGTLPNPQSGLPHHTAIKASSLE